MEPPAKSSLDEEHTSQKSSVSVLLPHQIYNEQMRQAQQKPPNVQSSSNAKRKLSKQAVPDSHQPKRRTGYVVDPVTGAMTKIIRRRKRKSAVQMDELTRQFEENPKWSKDTLNMLSIATGLSEGQVYKWGWDQKRKRFGPEEAERMRQAEMQMNKEIDAKRKKEAIM